MAQALRLPYSTERLDTEQIGQAIDDMMKRSRDSRSGFERRWYDNNFFDDGFHFRYLSRQQNKIVDLSRSSSIYNPMRAIPKASRQIRGVANLLMSTDPVPVVYPEKISFNAFPPQQVTDPQTGQTTTKPNPEYKKAMQEAKAIAKASGHWISEEFKKQNILEKIALMIILAAKHGVSYLQIWPDALEEAINTAVFDAFDIFLIGSLNEMTDSPFVGKATPRFIAEIKADERFDPEKVAQINPDNRHAGSEIKDAYMKARHGGMTSPETAARVIEKEWFVKEYLNDENTSRVKKSENGAEILKGKNKGDPVLRHTFVIGEVAVLDEYVNLPDYPFVDFRFEPGPLYQVPLIERFVPVNKSLDLISSRIERYTHTMVTGMWLRRQGEQFEINNTPGGQEVQYQATPPVQGNIAPIPNFVFNYMNFLTGLIEEQGVTTTTLGKIPSGVRANAAIETLKESEFSNLVIANRRLQGVIKRIAEKFLDLADNYFVSPQSVYYLEKGEPQYFDIIGASAIEKRNKLNIATPNNIVPIKKDYHVDIQVERGLGYTREAQKEGAKQLGDYMIQLSQLGLMSPEVVKVYLEQLLNAYGFGATHEVIEAMDQFKAEGQMTDNQIQAMKIAIAEVFQDISKGDSEILPNEKRRIDETKVGVAEAAKDLGLVDGKPTNPKLEVEIEEIRQKMRHAEEEHNVKMQQMAQDMALEEEKADADTRVKKAQAVHTMSLKERQAEKQEGG